jgi:hypothetical protein
LLFGIDVVSVLALLFVIITRTRQALCTVMLFINI